MSAIAKLEARSPVQPISIDAKDYPHIVLRLALRKPHLEYVARSPDKPLFKLYEIHDSLEHKITNFRVHNLKREATHLNVVWIVDASLSLNKKRFQKAVQFSQSVVQTLMRPTDKMAVYSAKDKPSLLLDFSSDVSALQATFSGIQHDGKVTRLYDAIYSGIYTAQSALQSKGAKIGRKVNTRTIVVLLTDGKEEASYLTDNDCYELSTISRNLKVPIYVVLFNEKHKDINSFSRGSDANHYRLLKRLTLKTSGQISFNPKGNNIPKLWSKYRSLMDPLYKIEYTAQAPAHNFFQREVVLRIALQEGDYAGISSYKISWLSFFEHSNLLLWFSLGFFVILLFILFAFIFMRHTKRLRQEQEFPASSMSMIKGRPPLSHTYNNINGASELARIPNKNVDLATVSSTPVGAGDENARYPTAAPSMTKVGNSMAAIEEAVPPGVLVEDERVLYLREYSYRMLQLALRQARPYKQAALRNIIAGDPSKKRIYDLFLDNTLLGSGRWAHIPLKDVIASPVHARIKKVNHRFVIYDLLSASGLYINNRKVLRPMPLNHGDEIRIGRSNFTFIGKN